MRLTPASMPGIIWEHEAEREFDRLPEQVRDAVDQALFCLGAYGHGDFKVLHGPLAGLYRLRVGEYRVRLRLSPAEDAIVVVAVRTRGSAYRE